MQRIAWILAVVLSLAACEESKDSAREKLLAMGYSADGAGFVAMLQSDRKSGEMVERFLTAEVSPLMQNEAGENALIIAVKTGDKELFDRFIALVPEQGGEGAPVNRKDASAKTALIHAVEQGRQEMAEALLKKGADILQFDTDVNTPLHHAVLRGSAPLVRLILAHADALPHGRKQIVDFPNHLAQTPLALALDSSQAELAGILLEAGADPNIANRRNYTPLMSAAKQGDMALVEALIGRGANVNAKEISGETPLAYALGAGHAAAARRLLEAGADPDIYQEGEAPPLRIVLERDPFDRELFSLLLTKSRRAGEMLYDLLHHAVAAGRAEAVEMLLGQGAKVNYVAPRSESLLYHAIDKDRTEIAALLLEHGAEISLSGASGVLPMEMALRRGNHEVVRLLLEKGANPDVKTSEGYSLAEMAVYKGFPRVLDLLLSKGARLNLDFALLWSIRDGGGNAAPVLLRYGANPNVMNQEGDSALLLAASASQTDAVKALLKYKASPDYTSKSLGMAPLAAAAYFGHLDTAMALVEGGADVNLPDRNGMTPAAHAAAHLKADVFEYLASRGARLDARDNMGRSIADLVAVATNSPDKQRILDALAKSREGSAPAASGK